METAKTQEQKILQRKEKAALCEEQACCSASLYGVVWAKSIAGAANELMNERTPAKRCQDRMIPVKSSSARFELLSRTGLVGRDINYLCACISYAAFSGYTCIVEQAGDLRRVAVAKRERTGSLSA